MKVMCECKPSFSNLKLQNGQTEIFLIYSYLREEIDKEPLILFRQLLIPSLHIIVKAYMRSKSVSQNSQGQSFKTSFLHRGMKPTCPTNRKHQSRNNLKPNKQKKITISIKTLLQLRLLNYLLDPETQAKLLFFTPYSIAC